MRWKHPMRGHRPARRVHPAARGDGADRRGRQVGARGGLPSGRRVARRPDTRSAWRSTSPAASSTPTSWSPTSRTRSQTAASTPTALTIEITETTLMRNVEETARRLAAIKELGVRIAIDDFGTGYSSLAHLQRFPVDALKIDRSFISGLQHNKEGETLIHTLVQLGKALSIETFAEGIEQQQELSLLQRRGLRQRPGIPVRPPPRRSRHRGIPPELGSEGHARPGTNATARIGTGSQRFSRRSSRIVRRRRMRSRRSGLRSLRPL